MPQINVTVGGYNLVISYEEGDDGFVEINHADSEMSFHVRVDGGELEAHHFVDGGEDPVTHLNMLTGDVYLD